MIKKSIFLTIIFLIPISSKDMMNIQKNKESNKTIQVIETISSPAPIGPYSQAVLVNNMLFISGQIPFDMEKKEIVYDISQATNLIMLYLESILNKANMTFDNVVKTTIYLTDMNDFAAVNKIYGSYFKNNYFPARETVQVVSLPKNAKVEISMIAVKY